MLIEFKVRGPKVQYSMDINMNYKVNIIRGHSATGKTSMYNCIDAANRRITGCSIECNFECIAARNLYELSNNKGAVIFIDENIWENMMDEAGNKTNMKEIIEKSSNYFVIITRNICDWLRVDVNAIYEIRKRGNIGRVTVNKVESIYNTKDVNEDNSAIYVDAFITEDGKSSKKFIRKYIVEKDDADVKSANGNKNVLNTVRNYVNKDKRVMIVLDSSDFGWMMDTLVDYIKENGLTHWYIFRPDSFEGYLLRTKFVNVSTECNGPVYNIEDMWAKKLNKALPLRYTKGELSKCIMLECGDKTLYKCDGCEMRTNERKRDLVVCGVLARVVVGDVSTEEHV